MTSYIFTALLAAAAAFYMGHRIADGACAKKELAAAQAAQERYHAKEIDYNTAATLLEQSRTALAARSNATTKQVQAIRSRPIYAGTCLDADGVRIVNEALRGGAADPGKPAR